MNSPTEAIAAITSTVANMEYSPDFAERVLNSLQKKKKKQVEQSAPSELDEMNNKLRLMGIKDRLNKFTVDTKLTIIE